MQSADDHRHLASRGAPDAERQARLTWRSLRGPRRGHAPSEVSPCAAPVGGGAADAASDAGQVLAGVGGERPGRWTAKAGTRPTPACAGVSRRTRRRQQPKLGRQQHERRHASRLAGDARAASRWIRPSKFTRSRPARPRRQRAAARVAPSAAPERNGPTKTTLGERGRGRRRRGRRVRRIERVADDERACRPRRSRAASRTAPSAGRAEDPRSRRGEFAPLSRRTAARRPRPRARCRTPDPHAAEGLEQRLARRKGPPRVSARRKERGDLPGPSRPERASRGACDGDVPAGPRPVGAWAASTRGAGEAQVRQARPRRTIQSPFTASLMPRDERLTGRRAARGDVIDLCCWPTPTIDVAAAGAAGADRRRVRQEPDARLEAELLAGQRAHRADVHDVAGVGVVERLAREGPDLRRARRAGRSPARRSA